MYLMLLKTIIKRLLKMYKKYLLTIIITTVVWERV